MAILVVYLIFCFELAVSIPKDTRKKRETLECEQETTELSKCFNENSLFLDSQKDMEENFAERFQRAMGYCPEEIKMADECCTKNGAEMSDCLWPLFGEMLPAAY